MLLKQLARFLDRSDGSLQQKAVRSGVWVGLSTVVSAGISFLRSIILARNTRVDPSINRVLYKRELIRRSLDGMGDGKGKL